ncbi:MAG: hypothetical protein JW745_03920 [Sedimentisphaerales bacterium]|nr:hypothetical protein [Sedimentisphaerales bacterium]MBN2843037.1 hypothetical protein [Sedimentisphaerales bacterium]
MTQVTNTTGTTTSGTTTVTGKEDQSISSTEFMEIMITELTNQDPFEPMDNADLVNQMAIIQQMSSNQNMNKSFEALMGNFDTLIGRNSLNTASGMIGNMVSGATTDGSWTTGRVVAVSQQDDNIYLELDTGQSINWQDVERLGGNSSQDIIGSIAVGADATGQNVVGRVTGVSLDDEKVTLQIQKFSDGEYADVLLANASLIDSETADLLVGRTVKGPDLNTGENITGYVESVTWTGDDQVKLSVVDSKGVHVGEILMDTLSFIS